MKRQGMQTARPTKAAQPETSRATPLRERAVGRWLLPVGCASVAALLTFASICPSAFRTRATVEVADTGSPTRQIVVQAALKAAVSKPVIARSATSLLGTNLRAPDPGLAERLAVALGLEDATGQAARLERVLVDRVQAAPGEVPGTIDISATAPDPEEASHIATAAAEALLADQEDAAAEMRRERNTALAGRLETLKAAARSSHQRLAALDPVELDPAQARVAASAQTTAAQNRLDAIKAIIASGSPPLSDRRDVPQTIETLQNAYLEISKELAKARETLGDRHTTVVALRDGVRRAAQNLVAEWKRLSRLAEAEVRTAKERAASLRKAETPAEIERRATFAAARNAAQAADDAVARAEAGQQDVPAGERAFRLVARAPVPSEPSGVSAFVRLMCSILAGLVTGGLASSAAKLPKIALRRLNDAPADSRKPDSARFFEDTTDTEVPEPPIDVRRTAMAQNAFGSREKCGIDPCLTSAMRDVVASLGAIDPRYGALPSIMLAANEVGQSTTAAALALGLAAAADGLRVLLIETERTRPELAAAADAEGEPILVDTFGALRVALRAEAGDGRLYLAPYFTNGRRIASALARSGDAHYIEELASDFDLVVIDGGRASESVELGWQADAYIRVSRFASRRDDERFLSTVEATTSDFIGTVAGSGLVRAAETPPAPRLDNPSPSSERPASVASYSRRSIQPGAVRPRAARQQVSAQRKRPG